MRSAIKLLTKKIYIYKTKTKIFRNSK